MSFFVRTLCALPAVAIATGAFAHVSLETREAKAGGSYKAVLKIPHGCDGSPVVKVHVEIPDGVIAVKPMPKPGWQIETKRGPYAKGLSVLSRQATDRRREGNRLDRKIARRALR